MHLLQPLADYSVKTPVLVKPEEFSDSSSKTLGEFLASQQRSTRTLHSQPKVCLGNNQQVGVFSTRKRPILHSASRLRISKRKEVALAAFLVRPNHSLRQLLTSPPHRQEVFLETSHNRREVSSGNRRSQVNLQLADCSLLLRTKVLEVFSEPSLLQAVYSALLPSNSRQVAFLAPINNNLSNLPEDYLGQSLLLVLACSVFLNKPTRHQGCSNLHLPKLAGFSETNQQPSLRVYFLTPNLMPP